VRLTLTCSHLLNKAIKNQQNKTKPCTVRTVLVLGLMKDFNEVTAMLLLIIKNWLLYIQVMCASMEKVLQVQLHRPYVQHVDWIFVQPFCLN
jgi:hypothetical protein